MSKKEYDSETFLYLLDLAAKNRDAMEKEIQLLRSTLEWMDSKGGLGIDVHDRIKTVLDQTAR